MRPAAAVKMWTTAVLVALLPACGQGPGQTSQTDQAPAPGASAQAESAPEATKQTLRFGLVPAEGGADIVERFGPLAAHLTAELGRPVEVFSATEYLGVILAMQNGQVDIGYFGPKSYVEANRVAGAVAVAKQLELDGTPGYYSVILTRAGSGIDSIEGARGKVFGFVSPSSTSGYLVPAIGLVELTGTRAEDYFGQVRYTGNHATSVRAVLAGDLDVAATNTLDLAAMKASGLDDSPLVELWRSELIPGSVIAVRRDMPAELREKVRRAVVGFSFADAAAMSRGGYVPADDQEYDVIRTLEQREADLAAAPG